MTTPADQSERLRRADRAWTTAQGLARKWRDRDLVGRAFRRHFANSPSAGWSVSFSDTSSEDPIVDAVLDVAFDAGGLRRRVQAVSRRQEEWLADLVVCDGSTFWARTGDVIHTNNGDPRQSHGGADIVKLLLPSAVLSGYELGPVVGRTAVAGRSCSSAVAVPREPDVYRHAVGAEVFDMVAGGDSFRLAVDDERGVLLQVVKLVDGIEAEVCEFLSIVFDAPLDEQLFAAL